jgi:hypothetical protein
MSNTRLCDLSLISIEHERARSLDVKNLARRFLETKIRGVLSGNRNNVQCCQ